MPFKDSILILALKAKNLPDKIIHRILAQSTNINVQTRESAALHIAIKRYHKTHSPSLDIIKHLLSSGASLIKSNYLEHTPLMEAVISKHQDIVDCILAYQADEYINLANNNGDTALLLALNHSWSPEKNAPIIEALILAGANPHIKNSQRKNAFDLAHRTKGYEDILTRALAKN